MTATQLESMNDEGLREVVSSATDLLARRDRERKERALREAGELLASVGLSLKSQAVRTATPKAKRRPAVAYHAGRVYQHPDESTLRWNGTGVRPKWLKELEAAGRRPLEPEGDTAKPQGGVPAR